MEKFITLTAATTQRKPLRINIRHIVLYSTVDDDDSSYIFLNGMTNSFHVIQSVNTINTLIVNA